MRVVIDAYWWSRGTQSLQNVVHGLVETWAESHPNDELLIVVPRKLLPPPDDLPVNVHAVGTRVWPHALSAMLVTPWHAWRRKADAVLSQNFSPLFGRRRGVFVQDVMFATNPEWFTKKELLYYRWMLRSARRSHVLFASTEVEGRRLRKHTAARRVVRAGLGLNADLVDGDGDIVPVPFLHPGCYFLAVGRLNIRKNLVSVLEGAHLAGVLSSDRPLVIVGERDGQWAELPSWVDEATKDGRIVFTGFVSIQELYWLISNTALYICLSLDEGFGLPPVEARVIGARVLASDIPVFRETLDDAVAFVDPTDVPAIARKYKEYAAVTARTDPSEELRARHSWGGVVAVIRSELWKDGPLE